MKDIKQRFVDHLLDLQNQICQNIEALDGNAHFIEDLWQRSEGGGGKTRVIANGQIFEKGGVNYSLVEGELNDALKKQLQVEQGWFLATGVSLVIHPKSPMVPTVHANWRYFELYSEEEGPITDCWFGGGSDLTPYYLFEEDAIHFHQTLKQACDLHDPSFYPLYKKQCDEYFYNHHRKEARGIGGLFFDYLRPNDQYSIEDWLNFVISTSEAFLPAYLPIVERRKDLPYTAEQAYFQEIRRGRYVEFNLIHDKGTLFGLRSNGRTESILMSLPPRVRWDYNYQPQPNSPEFKLINVLTHPRDWLASVYA